jgi:hypothetical protein
MFGREGRLVDWLVEKSFKVEDHVISEIVQEIQDRLREPQALAYARKSEIKRDTLLQSTNIV